MKQNMLSLILCLLLLVVSAAARGAITVQMPGGSHRIDQLSETERVIYFSLSQLAEKLGEKLSWKEVGLSVQYPSGPHNLVFFVDSPYFRINDSIKNLTHPARLKDGELYLPAETFLPFLDNVRPESFVWSGTEKSLRISREKNNITDLTLAVKANGLLVELLLSKPMKYELFTSEGNWLNITIPEGKADRRQLLSRKSDPNIINLDVFQFEKSAQISIQFRRQVGKFTHRLQESPDRIQISLIDTLAVPVVSGGPQKVGPDKIIDRIIIDAGHGGSDYGAIGLKSTKEKEIVLDIARRLAKLIRKEKIFEAVLTRDQDASVSLAERADLANNSQGDLFISVHANASVKRSARGFQVFFLAPAKNDSARAAAQLENASFIAEKGKTGESGPDHLSLILSDMIQTEFQTESSDLAAMIEKEMRKSTKGTVSRGIDQAGFFVLNGAFMPSVLIESAFITNRDDEKLLNSKEYRQKVAEAIYEGLKNFKAKYEDR